VYVSSIGDEMRKFAEAALGDLRSGVEIASLGGVKLAQLPPFEDRIKLEEALRTLQTAVGRDVSAEVSGAAGRPRSRLSDGLRIPSSLGTATYLHQGAPDLHYPAGELGAPVSLELNGITEDRLIRTALPFPLRVIAGAPGIYQGTADTSRYAFVLVAPTEVQAVGPGMGSIGVGLRQWRASASVVSAVIGAFVENDNDVSSIRTVAVPRGGDRTFLLGPRGMIRTLHEPGVSSLWKRLQPDVQPLIYLTERKQAEGWLVQFRGQDVHVHQLARVPASVAAEPPVDEELWRSVLEESADHCQTPEWSALVSSARNSDPRA